MQRIEAREQGFPVEVPERFVAVLSVHFLDADSVLNVSVRPGTDAAVRHLVEEWAAHELVRVALYPDGACEWEEHVLDEGVLMMQKYASVQHLPKI